MFELNKIYCENCVQTMSRMPDEFIDLVVTSPPYGMLRVYNGFVFEFEPVAKQLFRVIKTGGVLIWVVGDQTIDGSETLESFQQALYFKNECGFNLHDTMIYEKYSPPLTHNRYEQHFEYMFVLSKKFVRTFNPIKQRKLWDDKRKLKAIRREKDGSSDLGFAGKTQEKIVGNVWRYNIGGGHVTNDKIAHQHPAIFPEQLARDHIYSWSNEGDLIYDPFMGSGTIAKACIQMKRRWIGSEISQEYVDLANKRIEPYLNQLTIF